MPNEFDDMLTEITGNAAASPEIQQSQTQAAPAESNAFEAALAEKIQESEAPAQSPERDMPEPGGGRER
jgi:nucleoid-associated protein YgaU